MEYIIPYSQSTYKISTTNVSFMVLVLYLLLAFAVE